MSIRTKLSLTFILLLIFGVTAISSYSIMFIRGYLMVQAEEDLLADARQIMLTLQLGSRDFDTLTDILMETGRVSRYDLAAIDRYGNILITTSSDLDDSANPFAGFDVMDRLLTGAGGDLETVNLPGDPNIYMYGIVSSEQDGEVYFIEISRLKEDIYRPVKTMRWIIYSGMFISITIILFVSFIFSNYLSKPILQITESAVRIAEGDPDHEISVNRRDEFGKLAQAINRMASRLKEDNEQLRLAGEKQKQFYADIAHEIRNPMHTVAGTLELLEHPGLPEEKRKKHLGNLKSTAERINRLFRDLLTLQRSELDSHFLAIRPFDLGNLFVRMEEAYMEQVGAKGIGFEVKKGTCMVLGDEGRVEQVLDNLLSNAVKYTSEGHIRLSWEREDDKIKVSVKDTGIGISAEHLPFLFDRFYRTDKARARDSGGTGLGLAVVKRILEAHGTEISVNSRTGNGSEFTFSLNVAYE